MPTPLRSLIVLFAGAALGAGAVGLLPGGLFESECSAATVPDDTAQQVALADTMDRAKGANGASGSRGRDRLGTREASGPLSPTTYNPSVSLAPLVEELGPAVVHIRVAQTIEYSDIPRHMRPFVSPEDLEGYRMQQGEGTGFFISNDGYLLTNNHVVAGADEVTVTLLDERTFEARVVGTDSNTDIALVKVDGDDLPWVTLGSSEAARVGDRVVAIGNPFGLSHTVTEGIVSAKGRVIGAGPYDDFLQTDASINPGNSGGPLFNLRGEVVGINTAINPRGQGIGFAVPIDMVTPLIEDLKDDGKVSRGWLGVGLAPLEDRVAQYLDLASGSGTVVGQVYPGTPAATAGLLPGDVVRGFNGKDVGDSETLIRLIGSQRPGDTVALDILRDGVDQTIKVTLGERPDREDLERGVIPGER